MGAGARVIVGGVAVFVRLRKAGLMRDVVGVFGVETVRVCIRGLVASALVVSSRMSAGRSVRIELIRASSWSVGFLCDPSWDGWWFCGW